MAAPDEDIDPVEGLPSRAHPPVWGRYDERTAKPDTSVKDEETLPEEEPRDRSHLQAMNDPSAVHYRTMNAVGQMHTLCMYKPIRRGRSMTYLNFTNHRDQVTCEACDLSLVRHDRLEAERRDLKRAMAEKKRLEAELREMMTPAERAKELLEQQGPLPHMYDSGKPELRRMDEANRIARAQVWATLAVAEAMTRDEPEEVETVFRSTQGPVTKEQVLDLLGDDSKSWVTTPLEDSPAKTHYTIHTDGSVSDNLTGIVYSPDQRLLDVLTQTTLDERLPQKPAYGGLEQPLVIHYTRPHIDWTKEHPRNKQTMRRSRQRYQ